MSASATRLKRTPPGRNGPVRNRFTPTPVGAEPGADSGHSPFAPLENGVRTAYAVIEDYLHRGQTAAFGMYNDSNRQDDMNDYRGNPCGYTPFNPFSMLAEQWLMAMRAWTQAWGAMMPGAWQSPWTGPGYAAQNSTRLTVQVSSKRPTEVSASIAPGVDVCGLVCDPLHIDGGKDVIAAPVINSDQCGVHLTVTIGDQPAGRYRGSIRRRDGCVAGEITVNVV